MNVTLTEAQVDWLKTMIDQAVEDEDPDGEFALMAASIAEALDIPIA